MKTPLVSIYLDKKEIKKLMGMFKVFQNHENLPIALRVTGRIHFQDLERIKKLK